MICRCCRSSWLFSWSFFFFSSNYCNVYLNEVRFMDWMLFALTKVVHWMWTGEVYARPILVSSRNTLTWLHYVLVTWEGSPNVYLKSSCSEQGLKMLIILVQNHVFVWIVMYKAAYTYFADAFFIHFTWLPLCKLRSNRKLVFLAFNF